MKKKAIVILGMLTIGMAGFSQAVKDRQVIPVAVNLNQVLRMTIINGGNIEFVFNSIEDYRLGLSGALAGANNPASSAPFYVTDFTVASSARWALSYGSEQATFMGTDDPTAILALDNVGFSLVSTGNHTFETGLGQGSTTTQQLWSDHSMDVADVAGLEVYPTVLIDDNGTPLGEANAGSGADNAFQMVWYCGTGGVTTGTPVMEPISILDQIDSPAPDRYVTNVIFELALK